MKFPLFFDQDKPLSLSINDCVLIIFASVISLLALIGEELACSEISTQCELFLEIFLEIHFVGLLQNLELLIAIPIQANPNLLLYLVNFLIKENMLLRLSS